MGQQSPGPLTSNRHHRAQWDAIVAVLSLLLSPSQSLRLEFQERTTLPLRDQHTVGRQILLGPQAQAFAMFRLVGFSSAHFEGLWQKNQGILTYSPVAKVLLIRLLHTWVVVKIMVPFWVP